MKTTDKQQHNQITGDERKAREFCLNGARSAITSIHDYIEQAALTRFVAWYSLYESAYGWRTERHSTNH